MTSEKEFSTEIFLKASIAGQISVVIVTWNHTQYLPHCLGAITNQTYSNVDITVVDNASEDGSAEWISANMPQIRLVRLNSNQGFSKAFNLGAKSSDGEFVLSLNPDVKIRPDFLSNIVYVTQKDVTIGIVTPKLLRADDPSKLDSTGLFINRRRCPYDRGQGEIDRGQYDQQNNVFGACGAAALYRKAMLEDLKYGEEYFDEDFFAYYEDADLVWRAQLSGWRAVYEPKAVGSHVRGWGDSLRKQRKKDSIGPRLALRNRYLMCLKNDRLSNFVADLPYIVASEIPRLVYATFTRPSVLLGVVDFIALSRKIIRKRRYLWRKECVKTTDLKPWFTR